MSVLTPPPPEVVQSIRGAWTPEARSSTRLWLMLGYLFGPVAAVGLAAWAAGFSRSDGVQMLLVWEAWLVLTGVLVGGMWTRLARRPLARHLGLLLGVLLAGFAIMVAVGMWTEAAHSLRFGFFAALPGLALVCAVVPWQRRARRLHFALLRGGLADEMPGMRQATWLPLSSEGDPALPAPVDAIVVDLHTQHPTAVLNALATQALRGVPILHVAAAHELLAERVSLRFLSEESLQEYGRVVGYDAVKRVLDVLVVLAVLPLALPLMAVVALVVRMESPGPIFFRQRRVGHLGRPFTMYKFRSMDHRETALEPQFTQPEDARVTRVGRFIRKFRVDELPQFWNVLRGDMSIIGPRPEQVPFVETFEEVIPLYPYRHTVRPGITGWSQVKLGYAASAHEAVEKLEYDLYYVKHLSFSLDLLILFKTLRTIVTGYGAR